MRGTPHDATDDSALSELPSRLIGTKYNTTSLSDIYALQVLFEAESTATIGSALPSSDAS